MRRFGILLIFVVMICLARTSEARKLALLVGVDEYRKVPSLKCCVNDMKTLKNALLKIGFAEDDIQILTTGGSLQDLPTKEEIEQRIAKILSSAQPNDLVFFAFSGHGAQDGKKTYFCPPFTDPENLEGTCVSISKVMDDLAECQAKFKWVVVDACRNDPTQGAKSIGGKGLQTVPAPPAGIALFQSCAEGEESWEDRATGNGYFTKNFAAALSGAADGNNDGKLTLMEVCSWTTAKTKEQVMASQNKSQKPYFSGSFSDFILMENLNVPKAQALVAEARKAYDAENYALAIEKFDAALALCPQFVSWKRERDAALKLLKRDNDIQEAVVAGSKLKPTSRYSFEYGKDLLFGWKDRKTIVKFIGKETDVVIPKGVTVIESNAFANCSFLKSVVIPLGVTNIKYSTFHCCRSLKFVVIPEGVTEIQSEAFSGCSSLTSVIIPEGVTNIGSCSFFSILYGGAFSDCISLTSIVIPKSVTKIGSSTFSGCRSLTSVVIPEGVTEIGWRAFFGCTSLTTVEIPDSVTKIGSFAFEHCPNLTICAPKGSRVEKYANQLNIPFKAK